MGLNLNLLAKTAKNVALSGAKFVVAHKSQIATGAAIGGYVYAMVETFKEAPDIMEDIQDAEIEKEEELNVFEKSFIVAKGLWRPIAVFAASTILLIINEKGNIKAISSLTAGQQLLIQQIDDLQRATVEEVGENKFNKIKAKAVENRIDEYIGESGVDLSKAVSVGKGNMLMIELSTGQLIKDASIQFVRTVEAKIQAEVNKNGWCPASVYYSLMHLEGTIFEDYVGFLGTVTLETVSHKLPDGSYITGIVPSIDMTEIYRSYKDVNSAYDL